MSNHTREGDWYCKQCGYLSASRVTNAETCDMCHNPVVWHDVGVTQERIDLCVNALADRDPARLGELEKAIEELLANESLLESTLPASVGISMYRLKTALAAFRTPVAKVEPTQEAQ